MIIGILHKGSGLGDQLFSYIATRVRAADLGVPFGFVGKEFWKGKGWMDLEFGKEVDTDIYAYFIEQPSGKLTFHSNHKVFELNKPYYDPEFNFIPDGSVIDGYGAQDIRYFEHRLDEVREWLKTRSCKWWSEDSFTPPTIINFRGGEYKSVPELFLPLEYWQVGYMQFDDSDTTWYQIHTDDPEAAKLIFKHDEIVSDVEKNWNALRYSRDAVISNSAFAIIPRLLAHQDQSNAKTIAPKYWAGRNVREWRRSGNYYKKFTYI